MSTRRESLVVGVMVAVWLGLGSMHFIDPVETARQLPPWFPWKTFVAYASGDTELVLGVALVPRATRRWAAWGTLALLIAFMPAVVHFVWNDIVPVAWGPTARFVARWIVIPHHLLFGYAACWVATRTGRDERHSPSPPLDR